MFVQLEGNCTFELVLFSFSRGIGGSWSIFLNLSPAFISHVSLLGKLGM